MRTLGQLLKSHVAAAANPVDSLLTDYVLNAEAVSTKGQKLPEGMKYCHLCNDLHQLYHKCDRKAP